ncbi:coniferyl aldehyde dehydrogenase [Ideonella sp. B7]|uniref:coniferyl aldehyde dehydrogenase n=1 Tax=Ideonella benzenivorans TaxID=2831643 RepID=UPI001CED5A6F|nr:coniferyl aldehyde dehydrogenase [Ideonella benzenivorans]MCA6218396.1 coniferyl aldehyde dehydrogenase [Ideonella benzenivorans]
MQQTPPSPLVDRFEAQRQAFGRQPFPTLAERRDRLQRLGALLDRHEAALVQAISADFSGRSPHETRLAEAFVVRAGLRHALRHLKGWMRERRVPTQLHFLPGRNRLLPQPLGVVGVVAPWNYPLQLSLGPALAALAAGNRVLIKPSELTPAFSALLAHAVAEAFAPDEMSVVTGDASVGQAFSHLPFDHLFFTGSTPVGRLVAQAAAANLTPVTLELGGKSPAIIDSSADLDEAAQRIAYGKLLNAGQTCVAPDYVLVPTGQGEALARRIARAAERMYPTLRDNPDYTAIVSPRHHARLRDMVAEAAGLGATIMQVNPAHESLEQGTRKIAPTLVLNPPAGARLMREEIFGPVLPILEVPSLDAAIGHVQQGDRPLALYWFGRDTAHRDRVLRETISGGVTVNDCLWHLGQEHQPFGGVGASGMGAYHGEWGFNTFSKLKPVFHQSRWAGTALFRPPYGATFERLLGLLQRLG